MTKKNAFKKKCFSEKLCSRFPTSILQENSAVWDGKDKMDLKYFFKSVLLKSYSGILEDKNYFFFQFFNISIR